jgi:AraC-like DNA-binding protein
MERLPELAFGNSTAKLTTSSSIAAEEYARSMPSLVSFESSRDANFLAKTAMRKIGGTNVVAGATLSCGMQVDEASGWHFSVPYSGYGEIKIDNHVWGLSGGIDALLIPNMRRSTNSSSRSSVILSLDPTKFRETRASINGSEDGFEWNADRPLLINMQRKREIFPAFQHLCRLIDVTSSDPQLADQLGIEDMLYRWMAFALEASAQHDEQPLSIGTQRHRIDDACDLILSSSERTITLSELERTSRLSARALQYAFKQRFGCSPMEWQRRQRITLAHDRLIAAAPDETITSIAHSLGYSSSAAFAKRYKQHFGLTPSQTIRTRN